MAAVGQATCAFPGCARPRVPAPSGGGRPAAYCDDTGHTAVTAFRGPPCGNWRGGGHG